MTMRRLPVLFSILALSTAGRADPEPTAGEILRRMLRNDVFGFNGSEVRMRMVLTSRDGSQRARVFESLSRKDGDEVRSIVRFREPADVAGTACTLKCSTWAAHLEAEARFGSACASKSS